MPEQLFTEQALGDLLFNVDFLNNPTDYSEKMPFLANAKKKWEVKMCVFGSIIIFSLGYVAYCSYFNFQCMLISNCNVQILSTWPRSQNVSLKVLYKRKYAL